MRPLIAMKVCNNCGESLPLSAFPPNKQCKGGVTGTCRECIRLKRKVWYAANKERRQDVANERNRKRKEAAVQMFGGVCLDCKQSYPNCVFEFHHTDPSQKDINPSKAFSSIKWKDELEKCVMLCANCHRVRHFGG